MKPFGIKTERAKPDEVNRAISGVRSAMVKLASRMCTDDLRVALRAAQALREMGEFAGGPLALALSRAPDPRHRTLMLALLREIGSFADPDVFRVLKSMARNDPCELVARIAEEVLMHLLDRHATAGLVEMAEAGARRAEGPGARHAAAGPS